MRNTKKLLLASLLIVSIAGALNASADESSTENKNGRPMMNAMQK
jgi:hypothetical protein